MKKHLEALLIHIVRCDPELMAILSAIQDLPDCRLVSGCIYQTVWNVLTRRPRGHGIKDYDVGYFDASDLSWEVEDRIVQTMARLLPVSAPFRLNCGGAVASGEFEDCPHRRASSRKN
jgi:hypothetical protein